MSKRVELGKKLKEILGSDNVYFQPPDNLKMSYPCIRYRLEGGNAEYADNVPYRFSRQYELVFICKDRSRFRCYRQNSHVTEMSV